MIAERRFSESYRRGKFTVYFGKQRISLSINFLVNVNEGKLVDKEIRCLQLNPPSCISYAFLEI